MYKTIICAIEIGNEGKKVLAKAQEVAAKFESRLIIINVLPYTFLPKDYQNELKGKTLPEFEKFVSKFGIAKKNRALKVGKPYEAICSLADKMQADLIILGTHSKKGIHSLMGSTATAVANNSKCDVSLVKV